MNNKKSVIALLLIAIIGIVGLTIAYFANSTSVENTFTTKEYGTTYTESFVSPENWLPGDTTEKTLVATNTGEVDEAVRISLSETWTPNNSNATLTGWIHADGTKSNHTTENELATDVRAAVINFTENSDWTKVGDYYYYNYKLAPGESTTTFLESVTFNSKTKLDDTCETTIDGGVRTISCNSSGDDYDHAKYKLTINIETVQYNKYNDAWNLNNTVTILAARPVPAAVQYLAENATNAANAEYTNETKGKMFTFTHGENQVTETRYIGDDPNNYVYFNCDDMNNQSSSTCEVWRILGVFDVDDGTGNIEQRMKLVRGSDLATIMVFNSSNNNDWTVSPLKIFLNGDYYNRTGDAATYGLKASARNIIGDAKYYLGAVSWDSNATARYGTTEKIYGEERGNTVCGACNSDTNKLTWNGVVGLMYPSDEYMVYGNGVDNTCYTNPYNCRTSQGGSPTTGWIYNSNILEGQTSPTDTWFLSSNAGSSDQVIRARSGGYLYESNSNSSYGVRPVAYLKSDIKITEGTGESTNPYKLQ